MSTGGERPASSEPIGPGDVGFQQFVWLWNRFQGLGTPELHRDIAGWLVRRWRAGDRRLVLQVFRDAGKSTLVALFCAWLLTQNPDLRVLVLAAEHDLARKLVRNVRRIVERCPLTRGLMPGRGEPWASDQFTVRRRREHRDPSLLARGINANITGLRADVVICDDVEVPNTSDTPYKRAELRRKLQEVDFILVPGGLQLFIGTPHSYYSIYADQARPEIGEEEPFLASFRRLVIPLLDETGGSRWPERFTPEKIAEIRRRSGPTKFMSQMMLRPTSPQTTRLDPAKLVRYAAALDYREANGAAILSINDRRMVSSSCWWDPAYGAPGAGDASVVAAVFVDAEGGYWLHAIRYLQHDPALAAKVDEATQLCRQVARFTAELHLPSIAIETNGLGRFLPALLRRELAAAGVPCTVIEHASGVSKDRRILEAFDPLLAAGALHAHESVWSTPFIEEMREWRPGGVEARAEQSLLFATPQGDPNRAAGLDPDTLQDSRGFHHDGASDCVVCRPGGRMPRIQVGANHDGLVLQIRPRDFHDGVERHHVPVLSALHPFLLDGVDCRSGGHDHLKRLVCHRHSSIGRGADNGLTIMVTARGKPLL
jgi:hypothetical protein